MQEDVDEFGRVEVRSTDSEDDEVRKPTHGGCFTVNYGGPEYEGSFLMVRGDVSEHRGYVTDSAQASDYCFAVRPIPKQVSDYERVISKVQSILHSVNIVVALYESESDDLNFTVSSFSDILKRTRLNNSNLTDQINMIANKSEEIRIWNGVAERRYQTLLDMVHSKMSRASLPIFSGGMP